MSKTVPLSSGLGVQRIFRITSHRLVFGVVDWMGGF